MSTRARASRRRPVINSSACWARRCPTGGCGQDHGRGIAGERKLDHLPRVDAAPSIVPRKTSSKAMTRGDCPGTGSKTLHVRVRSRARRKSLVAGGWPTAAQPASVRHSGGGTTRALPAAGQTWPRQGRGTADRMPLRREQAAQRLELAQQPAGDVDRRAAARPVCSRIASNSASESAVAPSFSSFARDVRSRPQGQGQRRHRDSSVGSSHVHDCRDRGHGSYAMKAR